MLADMVGIAEGPKAEADAVAAIATQIGKVPRMVLR